MDVIYAGLVLAVALQRLVECVISLGHQRWLADRGAVKLREPVFPLMVAAHALLLVGCLVEVRLLHRPWLPVLGIPMLVLLALAMLLRVWVWHSLGRGWTVTVMRGAAIRVCNVGPYRWIRHPNYVAVVVEFFALPLVHGAWLTALLGSLLNLVVLVVRIREEERCLLELPAYRQTMRGKPRFLPRLGLPPIVPKPAGADGEPFRH